MSIFNWFSHKTKEDISNVETSPQEPLTVYDNSQTISVQSPQELSAMLTSGLLTHQALVKHNGVWVGVQRFLDSMTESNTVPEMPVQGEDIPAETPVVSEEVEAEEDEEYLCTDGEQVVTCPHCLCNFPLSRMNFISCHLDLLGDKILGADAQKRFLPKTFNEQGYAIDARGMVCREMACPRCHEKIPEAIIDLPSSLYSIVGSPASGKSYFLTSMIWNLRSILATKFDYTLADTDATFNTVLNNYESILFLNRSQDDYVALPKTELQGNDFSHQIILKGMSVDLPLPFIFTLTSTHSDGTKQDGREKMQNIVLYDNAGEHFEPGRDLVTNMATHHLNHSDGIMFLYDPLKDSRILPKCDSSDPQVSRENRATNQLILLSEMIGRIRKYAALRSHEKYNRPLVVILPKYDAWKKNFPIELESQPYCYYSEEELTYTLDLGAITNISYMTRTMLKKISPEVVSTCESFFSTVYFIPVSALGRMPSYDPSRDMIGIKPQNLIPVWVEVPMLLMFWLGGKLNGVNCPPGNGITIDKYKFSGDSLTIALPDGMGRESLPLNYCGYTVYNSEIGQYIQIPSAPTELSNNESDDESFWK